MASLETMIRDLEHMASDLPRQIQAEEERTGIPRPSSHFAYSTFAKAAAHRRANQMNSINDLRTKLDIARREHEEAALELRSSSRSRAAITTAISARPTATALMIG